MAETVEFFEFLQKELVSLMGRWKDYQDAQRMEEDGGEGVG